MLLIFTVWGLMLFSELLDSRGRIEKLLYFRESQGFLALTACENQDLQLLDQEAKGKKSY